MNLQLLFTTVFKNRFIKNNIFKYVNLISKKVRHNEDEEPLKWEGVKKTVSFLIKYNYIFEFKEYFKRYQERRPGGHYSLLYYESIRLCLRYSRLEMLQSLVNDFKIVFPDHIKFSIAIEQAAYSGKIETIEFLMNQFISDNSTTESNNYEGAFFTSPINSTDLVVIKWLYSKVKGKLTDIVNIYETTAIQGKRFIVEWLIENNLRLKSNGDFQRFIQKALEYGNIEFLEWFIGLDTTNIDLSKVKIKVNKMVINRQLDSLKWAKQHIKQLNCTNKAMDNAILKDDLELMKWLYENIGNCKTSYEINHYLSFCSLETIKWFNSNIWESFKLTFFGPPRPECLSLEKTIWYHENLKHFPEDLMDYASSCGRLDIIKWIHENRTEVCTNWAMKIAAKNGHLEVVQWLHQNRTEKGTVESIDNATESSNFEIVRFLAENTTTGCTESALVAAIVNNNPEIFCYLMDKVIPLKQQPALAPILKQAKLKFQSYNNSNSENNQSQEQMIEYFLTVVNDKKYKLICSQSIGYSYACEKGYIPLVKAIRKDHKESRIDIYGLGISAFHNQTHMVEYLLKGTKNKDISDDFFGAMVYGQIESPDLLNDYLLSNGYHDKLYWESFYESELKKDSQEYQNISRYFENHNYFLSKIKNNKSSNIDLLSKINDNESLNLDLLFEE